ncbi:MAG: Fe-S cluster biogenesis protein NfuA [Flavobacteriales bacterium]|jgi:Fe-S cluster biogenesis protein NfuA
MTTHAQLEEKVLASLATLRPYLEADGGNITLVEVTEDKRVIVELHGACSTCSMSMMTMKAGIEEAIKAAAPDIKGVEAINMPDPATATPFGQ